MDGGDSWGYRFSSSRRCQLRSESYFGGDDLDVEDEYKKEFSCPFCAEEFDIVGLFCHIDEEHQVEVKNGVCPVCAKRVGVDMVSHITVQHGCILKLQRKMRSRRSLHNSMFSILRKELREGNLQSLSGGSSFIPSSSNAHPDPLLSSFIYSSPSAAELGKEEPRASEGATSLPLAVEESLVESFSIQHPLLSRKDHEEKSRKCEFIQGLLMSTILDDIL